MSMNKGFNSLSTDITLDDLRGKAKINLTKKATPSSITEAKNTAVTIPVKEKYGVSLIASRAPVRNSSIFDAKRNASVPSKGTEVVAPRIDSVVQSEEFGVPANAAGGELIVRSFNRFLEDQYKRISEIDSAADGIDKNINYRKSLKDAAEKIGMYRRTFANSSKTLDTDTVAGGLALLSELEEVYRERMSASALPKRYLDAVSSGSKTPAADYIEKTGGWDATDAQAASVRDMLDTEIKLSDKKQAERSKRAVNVLDKNRQIISDIASGDNTYLKDNELVEMSLEDIEKRRGEIEAELSEYDAKISSIQKEIKDISGFLDINLAMSPNAGTNKKRVDELKSEMSVLQTERDKLERTYDRYAERYYEVENEEAAKRIKADRFASASYESAVKAERGIQAITDIFEGIVNGTSTKSAEAEKYIEETYGIGRDGRNGISYENDLRDLQSSIEFLLDLQKKDLSSRGYDYDRMKEYTRRQEAAAKNEAEDAESTEYAKQHPLLSTIDTVATSPVKGIEYLGFILDNIGNGNKSSELAEYTPLDTSGMKVTRYTDLVRSVVKSGITQKLGDGAAGNIATFLYDAGVSSAESLYRVLALGGGTASLLFAAGGAAADKTKSVAENGGSFDEAVFSGLAAGAAEMIFEKVSLDKLLENSNSKTIRQLLVNTLKQSGVEASEEMFTEIANIISDSLILGKYSDSSIAISNYLDAGMSHDDAKKQAMIDLVSQVAVSGLAGAVSGGMTNTLMSGINAAQMLSDKIKANKNKAAVAKNSYGAVQSELVAEGLESAEGTTSRKLAEKYQRILENGGDLTGTQLAALVQANEEAFAGEETAEIESERQYKFDGYAKDGRGMYSSNFPKGTPKAAKSERILNYIQNVWSKNPISLKITDENGNAKTILAEFDPTYVDDSETRTDATKLMGGNRHGTSAEQRVTLDLADDYYQLLEESTYNYSRDETGKDTSTHEGVTQWHYFVNDILFAEHGSDKYTPYRVSINIKEKPDGNFVYSYSAEKEEGSTAQRTLHAAVSHDDNVITNDQPSDNSISHPDGSVNTPYYSDSVVTSPDERVRETRRSAEAQEITAEDSTAFERASEEFGLSVRFYDAAPDVSGDGYYENGTIYLNRNARDPIAVVFSHELSHHAERAGWWNSYKDLALREMQRITGKDLSALRTEVTELYARHGIKLDTVGADAEIVAQFTQKHMLGNSEDLGRICEENPSLMQRVLDFIVDFLDRIGIINEDTRRIDRARRTLAAALRDSGKSGRVSGSVQYKASSGNDYSYSALINKPDMPLTTIDDPVDLKPTKQMRKDAVSDALNNAKEIGRVSENGGVYVHVEDIGTDILLSKKGLIHGLDRRFSENLPATLKAGEILSNAIKINELTPSTSSADSSYVLIGAAKNKSGGLSIVRFVVNSYTGEVDSINVLYALTTKKESAVLNAPRLTDDPLSITDSTISIARLLDYVNRYFPDVLPESALRHFGHTSRPDGNLGESALYSFSRSAGSLDADSVAEAERMESEGYTEDEIYDAVGMWKDSETGRWMRDNDTAEIEKYREEPELNDGRRNGTVADPNVFGDAIAEAERMEAAGDGSAAIWDELGLWRNNKTGEWMTYDSEPRFAPYAGRLSDAEYAAKSKGFYEDQVDVYRDIVEEERRASEERALRSEDEAMSLAEQERKELSLARGDLTLDALELIFDEAVSAELENSTYDMMEALAGAEEMRAYLEEAYVGPKIREISFSSKEMENNAQKLADMDSVHDVDESKLERTGKRPSDIFTEFFESWGNRLHSDELGEIKVEKSSVKSEIRHGITAEKIASIEAIPSVIKDGKIIFADTKPGSDVQRIVICAPIKIGDTPYYMGVMVQRDTQNQRLYLHNVALEKEASDISQADLLTTGADETSEHLFMTSILQNALAVKYNKKQTTSLDSLGIKIARPITSNYKNAEKFRADVAERDRLKKTVKKMERRMDKDEKELGREIATGVKDGSDIPASMSLTKISSYADAYKQYLNATEKAKAIKDNRVRTARDYELKLGRTIGESKIRHIRGYEATLNTPERVFRLAFDPDTAAKLISELISPMHSNEANATRLKSRMHNEIRGKFGEKIYNKLGQLNRSVNSDSQYLGEAGATAEMYTGKSFLSEVESRRADLREMNGELLHRDVLDHAKRLGMDPSDAEFWNKLTVDLTESKIKEAVQLKEDALREDARVRRKNKVKGISKNEMTYIKKTARESAVGEVKLLRENEKSYTPGKYKRTSDNKLRTAATEATAVDAIAEVREQLSKKVPKKFKDNASREKWVDEQLTLRLQIADELRSQYNALYDALNDMLVTHGYEPIGFIKDYFPHMQPESQKLFDKALKALGFRLGITSLPAQIAGRTDAFKPGHRWAPFMQHRTGGTTEFDAIGGFENYLTYACDIIFHMDDIQKLRALSNHIRTEYSTDEVRVQIDELVERYSRGKISKEELDTLRSGLYENNKITGDAGVFATWLDDYTNKLAGKQTFLDRGMEHAIGRGELNVGEWLQMSFARSAVVGNLSSAIMNTSQIPVAIGLVGYKNMWRAFGDLKGGFLNTYLDFDARSDFLTGKKGVDRISYKNLFEKSMDVMGIPFELVDNFSTRLIQRGVYFMLIDQGMDVDSAILTSDRMTQAIMGGRTKGSMPMMFENKNIAAKLVTTFQLEVANHWAFLQEDMPNEFKRYAKENGKSKVIKQVATFIVRYLLTAWLFNRLFEQLFGKTPAMTDVIGWTVDGVCGAFGTSQKDVIRSIITEGSFGDWEYDEEEGIENSAKSLFGDLTEDLPFVSNIAQALGITDDGRMPFPDVTPVKDIADAVFEIAFPDGEGDERTENRLKALDDAGAGIVDMVLSLVPGGSQIKKTYKGIKVLAEGGVYDGNGNLKYPVERNPLTWVQGTVFGTSALSATDEYYASGGRAYGEGETALITDLEATGMTMNEAADIIDLLDEAGARKESTTDDEEYTFTGDGYADLNALLFTDDTDEDEPTAKEEALAVLKDLGLTPEQEYLIYREKIASPKEVTLLDAIDYTGGDPVTSVAILMGMRGCDNAADKLQYLMDSSIDDTDAAMVFYGMLASEKERAAFDMLRDGQMEKSEDIFLTLANQKRIENTQAEILKSDGYTSKGAARYECLQESPISESSKSAYYYEHLATETDKDTLEELDKLGSDMSKLYRVVADVRFAENKGKQYGILIDSNITGDEQYAILKYKITSKNNREDLDKDIEDVEAVGGTVDDYLAAKEAVFDIESDKDRNGNAISNSKSKKMIKAIREALPDADYKLLVVLYELCGVAKTAYQKKSTGLLGSNDLLSKNNLLGGKNILRSGGLRE